MRVYVPVTFVALQRANASGALSSSGWRAIPLPVDHDDPEAAEVEALRMAAEASLAALRTEPEAPRRRAVVVAHIPDEWAESEPDGSAILNRRIPVERILALYADAAEATGPVVAALSGRAEALDNTDLLWFARQELPVLVG